MVKDRQDAKKIAVARKAAQRDKTSQIAGMLPDEEYIAMLSAIACPTPSGGNSCSNVNLLQRSFEETSKKKQTKSETVEASLSDKESKPLSKAERRLLKKNLATPQNDIQKDQTTAGKDEKVVPPQVTALLPINATPYQPSSAFVGEVSGSPCGDVDLSAPTIHLLSSNSAISPPTTSDESDDVSNETRDFASCVSGSCSVVKLHSEADEECGSDNFSECPSSSSCCAIPQWYTDAVAELGWEASAEVRKEGYEEYLYQQGHRNLCDPIVNPYILSEHAWWNSIKGKKLEALNAKLAKEMRLIKTGYEEHVGTKESSKTKENRKIEKFSLATSNRFAGLAKIR